MSLKKFKQYCKKVLKQLLFGGFKKLLQANFIRKDEQIFLRKKEDKFTFDHKKLDTIFPLFGQVPSLYQKLFQITKASQENTHGARSGAIEEAKETLAEVAVAFLEDPYHELLLASYHESKENPFATYLLSTVFLSIGLGRSFELSQEELTSLGLSAFSYDLSFTSSKYYFQKGLPPFSRKQVENHWQNNRSLIEGIFEKETMRVLEEVHLLDLPLKERSNREFHPWANIISICRFYGALMHCQRYSKKFSKYEAMKKVIAMSGKHLDRFYVKAFVDFLCIYPLGSVVCLSTGEMALVVKGNKDAITKPVVKVLLAPEQESQEGELLFLSKSNWIDIISPANKDIESRITFFPKTERVTS